MVQFIVTANEYEKAKRLNNYNLYIVFKAKSKNPKIWKIKNPSHYEGNGLYMSPLKFRVTVNTA